jgi:transposase
MINKNTNNKKQTLPQPQSPTPGAPAPAPHKARTIKLGVDVHLDVYVVVRIIDGTTPQPPQRFKPGDFLPWCVKQLTLAEKVFTCYEAGPFGYSLHRQLTKIGLTNYVIRPRDWDEYGKKVKTGKGSVRGIVMFYEETTSLYHRAAARVQVSHPSGGMALA